MVSTESKNFYDKKIKTGQDQLFLRMLCDTLDVGVSILDKDLRYQFISNLVYQQLGLGHNDLQVGDPLSKCHELMLANGMMTPEIMEKNKLSTEDQRVRNQNNVNEASALVQLGDGTTHRFTSKALENGFTVSMATNVTDLVEKDVLLDKALTLGNAGYWIYDFKTKKYTLSRSLEKFFTKKDIQKIQTQGIFSTVHPEDQKLFKDAIRSIANNSRFEVTARSVNERNIELWGQTTGEIVRDKNGKLVKMRAFVKDVSQQRKRSTELMQAKDEAIAASQAKSEFLANMSHEIRTPMNGILGMAELLSNSDINERQRDFLDVINNSASALLTIINDILDFSKIEADAFELDPTPFDLKSSVNDVTSILSMSAQEKGLELIINYPSSMCRGFIGDAGRLRQVLTNIVGNAIKFTDNGHITIDVDVADPRNDISVINICVQDTGIGIDPDKVKSVFNKFTQADGSTTRMYGGTGLGLSISKAIVEMMGGRIRVKSTLGKGSSFSFSIPLPIDNDAIMKNYDTANLIGKRALIIDDIAINRQILTEQLQRWDIQVDSVKDGVEALTILKSKHDQGEPYDIILLDYLMPGMNGQELATIISNSDSLNTPPMIMLSSCDQPLSNDEFSQIGIDAYLMKPVRERRLFTTIIATLAQGNDLEQPSQKSQPSRTNSKRNLSKNEAVEILVAEDFLLNQDVVRLMLEDSLYNPVFVNNGKEAVELYKDNPARFPAILMDVSMPVMDGYQATQLISVFEVSRHLTHIPIIALTGHALKNDREKCLTAGMDDYLMKPVKQTELLEKLDHWTGRAMDIMALSA